MFVIRRMLLAALLTAAALPASGEEKSCPSHPESTFTLQGDPDADRSQIGHMASAAKEKGAVCILAFYDGQGPSNAKMLAFRRANWVMELLKDDGVPASTITRVLRAGDKTTARLVQVVLGP